MKNSRQFPDLLQSFFTERLMHQRQASAHTIASYRDTFRLLCGFAQQRIHKQPSALAVQDLNAEFIGAFLSDLEKTRGIGARTRNIRLAAIHSFFRYVAISEPIYSAVSQRVLAIPTKRFDRKPIDFLTAPEIDALLAAPDQTTWTGRRDYTFLLTAVQTGLRVSELVGLRCEDIVLGTGAHIRCMGKGRKERLTPLRKQAVLVLRVWLRERGGHPAEPLFPNRLGGSLSRDGVEYLIAKHVARARHNCPTLSKKRVSAHVLRHSLAMSLLNHGTDPSIIALWLGHESVETTRMYVHADMAMKERALAKMDSSRTRPLRRYRPEDNLLAFLKSL